MRKLLAALFLVISSVLMVGCQGALVTTGNDSFLANEIPITETDTIPSLPDSTAVLSKTATSYPIYDGITTSIGDPYAPELGNMGYDVQRYTIKMALDPTRAYEVAAEVGIEAVLTLDHLESISLDFMGFNIQHVYLNGELAEFQRSESKLMILLPENSRVGDMLSLQIDYDGEATINSSRYVDFESHLGLFYPDESSLYVLSEPDGARYWIPCNDHPRDKALFRFEITVDDEYTAVANGTLRETRDNADETQTFIWQHDYPMATYLATVAVGKYERIESVAANGVVLRDYVFPHNKARWVSEFDVTEEAMLWMEEYLGPYPFEAYGHVNINTGGIALETQSMVVMSSNMIQESVMVHELAHQWLGNMVSLNSWQEIWRNEGFANYFEYLWNYRNHPADFIEMMDSVQRMVEDRDSLEPLNNLSPSNMFGYESYTKGMVVVHALRKEVGDEAFFGGLRLYLERYAHGTASNADFIAVMEEVSGLDLTNFFEYWLE